MVAHFQRKLIEILGHARGTKRHRRGTVIGISATRRMKQVRWIEDTRVVKGNLRVMISCALECSLVIKMAKSIASDPLFVKMATFKGGGNLAKSLVTYSWR